MRGEHIACGMRSGMSKSIRGKNAIGGSSATSEIALQRKGEGGQRNEARANAALIEPSSDFSGCCRHCSLALRLNVCEAGFYTPARRGSSRISSVRVWRALPSFILECILRSAILNLLISLRSHFIQTAVSRALTWSLQQCDEACLLEVMIAGQRFGQAFAFHHDERDAIGERPGFVRAFAEKADSGFKEFR